MMKTGLSLCFFLLRSLTFASSAGIRVACSRSIHCIPLALSQKTSPTLDRSMHSGRLIAAASHKPSPLALGVFPITEFKRLLQDTRRWLGGDEGIVNLRPMARQQSCSR